jgi:hypothetical protein
MYSDEGVHAGRPHFHAEYAGLKASYDMLTLRPMAGRLHPRANRLVVEWARMHQFELRRNWQRMRDRQEPRPIDPLP